MKEAVPKITQKNVMKKIENKNPTEMKSDMTRKERRAWFHSNRKDLDLPRWGELHNLETN